MKLDIITAEEACKLVDEKRGGVPSVLIDEALRTIDRTIRIAAAYEGLDEFTVYVGRLFFTNTGVIFSDDDEHKAARKIAKTLRKAGYKVSFEHIGSFNLKPADLEYREGMTVSWRK